MQRTAAAPAPTNTQCISTQGELAVLRGSQQLLAKLQWVCAAAAMTRRCSRHQNVHWLAYQAMATAFMFARCSAGTLDERMVHVKVSTTTVAAARDAHVAFACV
jgi:hypothetical protein